MDLVNHDGRGRSSEEGHLDGGVPLNDEQALHGTRGLVQLDLHLHVLERGDDEGTEVDALDIVGVEVDLVDVEGAILAVEVDPVGGGVLLLAGLVLVSGLLDLGVVGSLFGGFELLVDVLIRLDVVVALLATEHCVLPRPTLWCQQMQSNHQRDAHQKRRSTRIRLGRVRSRPGRRPAGRLPAPPGR